MSSSIKTISDYGDLCGESPLWCPRTQTLYWGDITGRRIYRYSWAERRSEILRDGFEVAGIALHSSGGLVLVNSGGLWNWDLENEPVLITDTADGRQCRFNDCIADPRGRVFSGSSFFDPEQPESPPGFLVRIETDGSAHIVDEGIQLANGLGFSPDQSTLYFTDSAERVIYAYDYRPDDGAIRNRRVFTRVSEGSGLPDGLTVDAAGYVWSAHWFGGCIVRYDPDGREHLRVSIPAAQSSSIAFGGKELADIFITSASIPDALLLAPPGYRAEPRSSGGPLFHWASEFRGKPEFVARTPTASRGAGFEVAPVPAKEV